MEEKNNSSLSSLKYVFVLIGVVALVASYFLGFTKYNEKCDSIDGEISSLEEENSNLKSLAALYTVDGVEKYVDECDAAYEKILAKFDGGIKYQSVIMDTYEATQKLDIKIPALTLGVISNNDGMSESADASDDSELSYNQFLADNGYDLQVMSYTFITEVPYEKMVDTIRYFSEFKGKRKVPTAIKFAYNTEKQSVAVSFTMNEYAIKGEGRNITIPTIPGYAMGDTNIFYDEAIAAAQAAATTSGQ